MILFVIKDRKTIFDIAIIFKITIFLSSVRFLIFHIINTHWISVTVALREKYRNKELVLVRIFLYSVWIQRFTNKSLYSVQIQTRENSVFWHILCNVLIFFFLVQFFFSKRNECLIFLACCYLDLCNAYHRQRLSLKPLSEIQYPQIHIFLKLALWCRSTNKS